MMKMELPLQQWLHWPHFAVLVVTVVAVDQAAVVDRIVPFLLRPQRPQSLGGYFFIKSMIINAQEY